MTSISLQWGLCQVDLKKLLLLTDVLLVNSTHGDYYETTHVHFIQQQHMYTLSSCVAHDGKEHGEDILCDLPLIQR